MTNGVATRIKAELLDADVEVFICDAFTVTEFEEESTYDKIFAEYLFGLKLRYLGSGMRNLERLTAQYSRL